MLSLGNGQITYESYVHHKGKVSFYNSQGFQREMNEKKFWVPLLVTNRT